MRWPKFPFQPYSPWFTSSFDLTMWKVWPMRHEQKCIMKFMGKMLFSWYRFFSHYLPCRYRYRCDGWIWSRSCNYERKTIRFTETSIVTTLNYIRVNNTIDCLLWTSHYVRKVNSYSNSHRKHGAFSDILVTPLESLIWLTNLGPPHHWAAHSDTALSAQYGWLLTSNDI